MKLHPQHQQHQARKRFGQNFLNDDGVIADIVAAIAPKSNDRMVEIGPGLAAMTTPLLDTLKHLHVVEIDRDLIARLKQRFKPERLTIHEGDALEFDFASLAGEANDLRVVGNLPYNISTPILFHLLDAVDVVVDQHFMLQKEVVDRMAAAPGSKDYGRLSVMLQWRYDIESVLDVPPECFDPPPRVDSAIVRMRPLATPAAVNLALLGELVTSAFSQRRKLLRHTLGHWLQERHFKGHFDLQRRAEEVPVSEYLALAEAVAAQRTA